MLNINISADLMITHAKVLTNYLDLTNGEKITNLVLPEFELEADEPIFFVVRKTHATLNAVKKENRKYDPHFKGRITSRDLNRNLEHKEAIVILTSKRICIYNDQHELLRAFDIMNVQTAEIKKDRIIFIGGNGKYISLVTNNMNINYRFAILLNMMQKVQLQKG